jgi:hypothetical protein
LEMVPGRWGKAHGPAAEWEDRAGAVVAVAVVIITSVREVIASVPVVGRRCRIRPERRVRRGLVQIVAKEW